MRIKMDDARTGRLKNMAINSTTQFNSPRQPDENISSHCPSSSTRPLFSSTYLNNHKVPDLPNPSKLPTLLNHDELLDDSNSDLMLPSTLEKYIPHGLIHDDLTEEDRRLAATLVAVQFQQKNQPGNMMHLLSQPMTSGDSKMASMGEPSLLGLPPLIGPNKAHPASVMPTLIPYNAGSQTQLMSNALHQLPPLKKGTTRNRFLDSSYLASMTPANIPLESLGIQTEIGGMDIDSSDIRNDTNLDFMLAEDEAKYSCDSEESETFDSIYDPSRSQSLPHKKRIHLRNPKKASIGRMLRSALKRPSSSSSSSNLQHFTCELCLLTDSDQYKFFEHLKGHYDQTGIPYQLEPSPLSTSKNNCIGEKLVSTHNEKPDIIEPAVRSTMAIVRMEPSQSSINRAASSTERTPSSSSSSQSHPIRILTELRPPQPPPQRDNSLPPTPPLVRGKPVLLSKFIENNIIPDCLPSPNATYDNLTSLLPSSPVVIHQCEICKRTFRRLKAYEAHMTNSHVPPDTIEEFSEPEDMMAGIRVNVDSDDDDDSIPLIRLATGGKNWYQENDMFSTEDHFDDEIKRAEEEQELQDELVTVADVRPITVAPSRTINTSLTPSGGESNARSLNVNPVPSSLAAAAAAFAVHSNTVSKFCGICKTSFKSRQECSIHISERHKSVVKAMTEMTSKPGVFKNKRNPLICQECGRRFIHRNSYKYHVRSHIGKRPYICNECGKSFFAKCVLKVHLRRHTGDRPFKCELCLRNFRQWGDLKYHVISIHTNKKEFQCEVCGKNFARKYSLTLHMRIHTGEKNYVCEFCDKKFRASSYLLYHRKIHTGEKPHKCDICDRNFRVKSDMKRHKLTHKVQSCCKRVLAKVTEGSCGSHKCDKQSLGQQINLTDICKAEGFEPSTVSGILTIDGVRTGKRQQETSGTSASSTETTTEPKSQTGVYFWQMLPTA